MNGPPGCDASEAVPSLMYRPEVVVGRAVPGLPPLKAVATRCDVPCLIALPVGGLVDVPGLAKPVAGRPDCVSGRIPEDVCD
jgi:hypothetical protein